VNELWVKAHLELLKSKIQDCKAVSLHVAFEPTDTFYARLAEGEEEDLQLASGEIAQYMELEVAPAVHYDWGVKMELGVAGLIKHHSYIQIPFAYLGKKFALGGILAHEMTHAFLFNREIVLEDPQENEALTDLAAIFIGLGKLILNGYITTGLSHTLEILGYLSPELLSFAYKKVCVLRSIRKKMITAHLTPEALRVIRRYGPLL
jgi:hypothetical protein